MEIDALESPPSGGIILAVELLDHAIDGAYDVERPPDLLRLLPRGRTRGERRRKRVTDRLERSPSSLEGRTTKRRASLGIRDIRLLPPFHHLEQEAVRKKPPIDDGSVQTRQQDLGTREGVEQRGLRGIESLRIHSDRLRIRLEGSQGANPPPSNLRGIEPEGDRHSQDFKGIRVGMRAVISHQGTSTVRDRLPPPRAGEP